MFAKSYTVHVGRNGSDAEVFVFKKILLTVLILSIACPAQVMQQLKKTVAFVYGQGHVKGPDGKSILIDGPLGTAFFVLYPDPRGGADYGFIYMVTAKHVLKDELEGKYLDKVRLRMNKKDGSGVAFAEIPVSDRQGTLLWLDDKDDPNAILQLDWVTRLKDKWII